jgi:hypothetical protein
VNMLRRSIIYLSHPTPLRIGFNPPKLAGFFNQNKKSTFGSDECGLRGVCGKGVMLRLGLPAEGASIVVGMQSAQRADFHHLLGKLEAWS